ncbi:MAG: sensor histidine kinase [Planctomycetota bacterium]
MSSSLERRAAVNFTLRLVFRNSILFLIAAGTFYVVTRHVLYEALSGHWEEEAAAVRASWVRSHAGVSEEVILHVSAAQVELSQALREQALQRFERMYLIIAVALLVASAVGGSIFTYMATAPQRRIVRTVVDILATGDLDRRVSAKGVRGTRAEIVGLINRLLDRNASLVRAIHDTLDNVAHDLRTPMTRLRATAEKALQRPEDHAAGREAIADCLEESERVLTMLNTLMEVAEAQTGAMRLDRKRVELDEVVRDVVDLYALVAEERGASVVTRIEGKVAVHADPTRLRQALANLLDNALKYGGKGNVVTVSLSREGADAVLEVADTGPGIPTNDLPRIWERLYRGDKSRTERGLGLGLSFVRAIVEAHGGRADVESEVGRGARFRIRIPAVRP